VHCIRIQIPDFQWPPLTSAQIYDRHSQTTLRPVTHKYSLTHYMMQQCILFCLSRPWKKEVFLSESSISLILLTDKQIFPHNISMMGALSLALFSPNLFSIHLPLPSPRSVYFLRSEFK
jgi:hypothetical protein